MHYLARNLGNRRLRSSSPALVNRSNPLAAGLISLGTVINRRPFDVLHGVAGNPSGATGIGQQRHGMSVTTGSTSGDSWDFVLPAQAMAGINTCSVFVIAYSVASSALKRSVRLYNSVSGSIAAIDFGDGGANKIRGTCQVSGGTFPTAEMAAPTPTAGQIYSVLYLRDGTTQSVIVDGADRTSGTGSASSNNFAADINRLSIGSNTSNGPLQGGVFFWAAWNRVLSSIEAKQLYERPFRLIRAQRQLFFGDQDSAAAGFRARAYYDQIAQSRLGA